MNIAELLRWQWNGYEKYHRARANLLLHIVVVPMFLLANIALLLSPFVGSWVLALVSLALMVVSVALQGRGHGMENIPSVPFTGPVNAITRLLLEQWITFPRFVLTGGWWHALRQGAGVS